LAIEIPFYDAVGADDADGVLEAIETRNLRKDRALRVDLETGEDFRDKVRVEVAVFIRERVDGRVKKILRNGELA
jgi:hypothetical protein